MNAVDSVLGKQITNYKEVYDPYILAVEPRERNRVQYGIKGDEFHGVDVLHAYETSFLLKGGAPIQGVTKIIYDSTSEFIVESKSLKLYLFSLMMTPLGETHEEAVQQFEKTVRTDLERALKTHVQVKFFDAELFENRRHLVTPISGDFRLIETFLDVSELTDFVYQEDPELLDAEAAGPGSIAYMTNALRSRCKITSQPDWGTIAIRLKGKEVPTPESLYRYIVSFRNENHFHEEIVEAVYSRLSNTFKPDFLQVAAFYTRRGGIDINPVRCSHNDYSSSLTDINRIFYRTFRS
jgi:7-cyano-7-deazaguanine reductase